MDVLNRGCEKEQNDKRDDILLRRLFFIFIVIVSVKKMESTRF